MIVVKKTVNNHHTTVVREPTTKTTKLSVTQQNCIAGALQLGFTSNADNRADATYSAVVGCFS